MADARLYGEAVFLQVAGEQGGGLLFLKTQLGVIVDLPAEVAKLATVGLRLLITESFNALISKLLTPPAVAPL